MAQSLSCPINETLTRVDANLQKRHVALNAIQKDLVHKCSILSKCLGLGAYSGVYEYYWEERSVAIKKFPVSESISIYDQHELLGLNHANVVKIFLIERALGFKYVMMEKSETNLEIYCRQRMPIFSAESQAKPFPTDFEALSQMADGLDYLHSKHLVHRSINPYNVLVFMSHEADRTKVTFKLSDFGICRPVNESALIYTKNMYHPLSLVIYPPESIQMFIRPDSVENDHGGASARAPFGRPSGDIFSLGCTFFFYLTRGEHYPFSRTIDTRKIEVVENVLSDTKFMRHLQRRQTIFQTLIEEMIDRDPRKRPVIVEVKKKLEFLQRGLFDYFLRLPYSSASRPN